jgi:hypothetical protein
VRCLPTFAKGPPYPSRRFFPRGCERASAPRPANAASVGTCQLASQPFDAPITAVCPSKLLISRNMLRQTASGTAFAIEEMRWEPTAFAPRSMRPALWKDAS